MRILLGPVSAEDEEKVRHSSLRIRDECVFYSPEPASYVELASRFPAGWQPDVALHWSLEYNPPPEGIENADCLTACVLGDWNLGAQAYTLLGGAFDWVFADRNGCARLREAGFENVTYAPLWAFDPKAHRLMPNVERDLDIVMIGNFNHEVQRERAKWLARVAKLARKYRVCVTSGVYGEDYTRLLNRAKIVFNRSIRGEINMRAYEAPACGALLFYERENMEIRDLFTDRQECVLYGDDDLEDLLDYYLTQDEERARVAEAGWRKVQTHSWTHHHHQLLDLIETKGEEVLAKSGRPLRSLSPAERPFRRACYLMTLPNRNLLFTAERELAESNRLAPANPDTANARACLFGELAASQSDPALRREMFQQALAETDTAIALRSDYMTAWFNRAQIFLAQPDIASAVAALEMTWRLLHTPPFRAEPFHGPYYRSRFDLFLTELERVWGAHPFTTPSWIEAMRELLLWRVCEQLSDLAYDGGRFAAAAEYAAQALVSYPQIGATRYRLARSLSAMGRMEAAEQEYRLAQEDLPFSPEIWNELAALLLETKQYDECITFLEEIQALLEGCPFYAWWQPTLDAFRASLQTAMFSENSPAPRRFLALPDWSDPTQWQPLLRGYVQRYQPGAPVNLLLPIETERVQAVVSEMESFLREELSLTFDDIPDVTLLPQSLESASLPDADTLILVGGQNEKAALQTTGLTTLLVEQLGRE